MSPLKSTVLLAVLTLPAVIALRAADEPAAAAEPVAAAPGTAIEDVMPALMNRINAKLQAGQTTEEELTEEIAAFDALLAAHADEKTDEVAQVAFMKALLYVQVFEDFERGEALLNQIATDFPDTEIAASLPRMLATIKAQAESAKVLEALVGQPAPALNFTWSSRAGLKTLDDLKGKVVVLDFWATWCGPCIASFPNLRELAAHYAGTEVEIVGVTSLQGKVHGLAAQPIDCTGDAAKEHGLMTQFIEKKNITWTVSFSQEEVFNDAWGITGIPYVAILAPDGTVRHAGLHPSEPLEQKTAKIDALLEEFGLKRPVAAAAAAP